MSSNAFSDRFGKLWNGMRRALPLLVLVIGLPLVPASPLRADDADPAKPKKAEAAKPAAAASLPLTKVALFSSGVGFFEHSGEVNGDAHVDLQFKVQNIDDLLKSMVLQDFDGGHIATVNYGSKEPIAKTLESFSIDLNGQPTMADLLRQLRGEAVEVDVGAPQPITGTIIGVEKRKIRAGKDDTVTVDYLNLLTPTGLQSTSMENVVRIKLNNAKLNSELQQALAVLSTTHDTDKKTVTLHFLGNGTRHVRVGYVQEAPLWRTSYRLVLKDKQEPFLQGWAIVENPTEQDWKNVSLTLISGRPISFVMDLYDPLYLSRPTVVPQLFASLRPQTYDQDMAESERMFRKAADGKADENAEETAADDKSGGYRNRNRQELARAAAAAPGGFGGQSQNRRAEQWNLERSGRSMAEAGKVGELFKYEIDTPVTLARRESAMLPIVNESVKAKKVSIYNQQVQAKYPLNGLKLTNSTSLHLMQGPITVFDGDNYAGDAQIDDIQPGAERLISYALDLDTEVAPESIGHPDQLINVRIVKGTLYASHKYMRTEKYTIKNSGRNAKDVLIEYPLDPAWTLVSPSKPAEKTRDMYRFSVEAAPGKPAELAVEEERTDQQQFAITNLDNGTIAYYSRERIVSPKVKEALEEVIKRKDAIEQLVQQRQQLEQQVRVIDADQSRIRQNMHELDHTLKIYTDYVEKFSKQETQIDALHKQIEGLQSDENAARKSLDDYLVSLDLS